METPRSRKFSEATRIAGRQAQTRLLPPDTRHPHHHHRTRPGNEFHHSWASILYGSGWLDGRVERVAAPPAQPDPPSAVRKKPAPHAPALRLPRPSTQNPGGAGP